LSLVIGIIGVPGTGKSTLMKKFMEGKEWTPHTPVKLVQGYTSGNMMLLGKYEEGEVFCGTDRLSMAVQPAVIEYLEGTPAPIVIFEGDRLNSVSFFEACKKAGHEVRIIILNVSDEIREQRYKDRGSDQSEKFIKGRFTKVKNVSNMFGPNLMDDGDVSEFKHEVHEDTELVVDYIQTRIKDYKS